MAGEFFKGRFKTDSRNFSTTREIEEFYEKTTGSKIAMRKSGTNLVSNRGNSFPIKKTDPDKAIDSILKKISS